MDTLIEIVLVTLMPVLALALTWLISSVAAGRQSAAADRRSKARRGAERVRYPVRLRGQSSSYPGFWRAGWLSQVPATFVPRGRWGPTVTLAGAVIRGERASENSDYLPPTAENHLAMTYVDGSGRVFRLATAPEDAPHVKRLLTKSRDVPAPPSARVPLQWVRNRVPLFAVIVILLGFLAMVAQGYAMVSATSVRATISLNPGGDSLCRATATDASGRFVEGWISCAAEYPGDQVDAYVLGWPRTGTLTDRQRDSAILVLPVLAVLVVLFMTGMLNLHSRRIQSSEHGR